MKFIRKKIVIPNLVVATSFFDLALGLLIKPKGTAMLFKTHFGIHTFFMKYPIDVLILNKNMQVVQIKKKLKPNRFFFWNPTYFYIIEMSSQKKSIIKLGDLINNTNSSI